MEKVIFETNWIKIKRTPRGFDYLERKGIDSVAIFLIRQNSPDSYDVLIRYQPLCIDNVEIDGKQTLYGCPVTGGLEEVEVKFHCVLRKVQEETGYKLCPDDLHYLTTYIVGTQTNEKVWLYIANVTYYPEPAEAITDGSYFESVSRNEWTNLENLGSYDYVACQLGYHLIKAQLNQQASL